MGAQVDTTELQQLRQRVASESGNLDEALQKARQDVAREAQVRTTTGEDWRCHRCWWFGMVIQWWFGMVIQWDIIGFDGI